MLVKNINITINNKLIVININNKVTRAVIIIEILN